MIRFLMSLALLFAAPIATAQSCGGEEACEVEGGAYHIALPDGWSGGPAVLHLHGFGGSGEKVIRNTGFVDRILARGYAVIAPSGLPGPLAFNGGNPPDWAVRDGLDYARDDVAFMAAVLDDATARHGVARDRVLMTGFSRGGSMTWEVACLAPGLAAAYAPTAGGFWLPEVTDCAGPVRLFHIHGFADPVVPLEGRRIPVEEGVTQGDIWRGLTLWRAENTCRSNAALHRIEGGFWQKNWLCEEGSLSLALHEGGHSLPPGWVSLVIDWFEEPAAVE